MTRARTPGLLLALALVALPVLPAGAGAAPAQEVFVLDGRGHGHGVGMAQDSANAMAAAGSTHQQILGLFYPGTRLGSRSSAIRVAVWEAGAPTGQVGVAVPGGARVSGDGAAAQAPAGAVLTVSSDAAGFHVRQVPPARGSAVRAGLLADPSPSPSPSDDPLIGNLPSTGPSPGGGAAPSPSPAGASPPPAPGPSPRPSAGPGRPSPAAPRPAPTTASPSSEPLFAFDSRGPVTITPQDGASTVTTTGRTYRGSLIALSASGFRLVNVLDIEDYLRGLGEVPPSWPMAALRTQAVAARTYALRAVGAGRPLGYDVCDDTRCQVYLGMQQESPRTTQAARDTRGQVVTYNGSLADTFYSANAGGITATPAEGFGGNAVIPYLPGGTKAPGELDPWTLRATPQDIARRLSYGGRLDAISIAQKGPSGRATRVRLEGAAGTVELTGVAFQRKLGLRSNLFTVARAKGAADALPAAADEAQQLPPAEAATVPALPEPGASPTGSSNGPPDGASILAGARGELPAPVVGTAVALLVAAGGAVLVAAPGPLRALRRVRPRLTR